MGGTVSVVDTPAVNAANVNAVVQFSKLKLLCTLILY